MSGIVNEFKAYKFDVDLYRNGTEREVYFYFGTDFIESDDKKIFIIQDGQFALDENEKNEGVSWELHRVLSKLEIENYLILAISSNDDPNERIREYSFANINYKLYPELEKNFIPGCKKYINSIIDTIIPEMEKKFDFNYLDSEIIMVGAGFGSLPVTYAAYEYKDIFSGYIILSPPFFTQLGASFIFQEHTFGDNVYLDIEANVGGKKIANFEMSETAYEERFNEFFEFLKYSGKNVYRKIWKESFYSFKDWKPRVRSGIQWYLNNKIER